MTSSSGQPVEFLSNSSSRSNMIFQGSNEYLIKNREMLLQERINLFDGRNNTNFAFSVVDLNSMNVNSDAVFRDGFYANHAGVWRGKPVIVKIFGDTEDSGKLACCEIAIAAQRSTHSNVQRILGCCLDTNCPVLVYEWPENGTLDFRVLSYNDQMEQPLEWKDRLRLASKIGNAIADLHTAIRVPATHRDLKPKDILLDRDGFTEESDMSLSITIPEGKKHDEDDVIGRDTWLSRT